MRGQDIECVTDRMSSIVVAAPNASFAAANRRVAVRRDMLVLFAYVQRSRGSRALVPPDVLHNKTFAMASLAVLMMSAIFFSALLYLPQFMAKELGFSAVRAGAGLLPMMAVFAATSFAAGALYQRLGAKVIVSTGALCLAVGIFELSFLEDTYRSIVPGMSRSSTKAVPGGPTRSMRTADTLYSGIFESGSSALLVSWLAA